MVDHQIRIVRRSVRHARKHALTLVPVLIFVACLSIGVIASAQWLPDFAEGEVGGIALLVVCGLLGTALALVGLHIYSIVEAVNQIGGGVKAVGKGEILATGLVSMSWEAGSVLGLATVVYLLAPPPAEAPVKPH
jgi:hypothetical protein